MIRHFILQAGAAAVLGASVLAAGAPAVAAHAQASPNWLVFNTKAHTATLTLVAGYSDDQSGFNFNGYAKGAMVVTVRSGDKVTVVFSNKAPMPHSAEITAYSQRAAVVGFKPAFAGAYSPDPTVGVTPGKVQRFSFVAKATGTYAIVCSVPGHAAGGMWDTLKVVAKGTPSITISR
jgi:uncharacterized cupredoxin-like copper-binding protein